MFSECDHINLYLFGHRKNYVWFRCPDCWSILELSLQGGFIMLSQFKLFENLFTPAVSEEIELELIFVCGGRRLLG